MATINGVKSLEIQKPKPSADDVIVSKRSIVMNRCLHRALTDIAQDLQNQGIERRTIIEDLEGYEAPITMEWMKEVYKSIVYTMYRKTSTTDLTNKEMIDSWEVFSRFLSEQYGVSYTWPSQEAQYWESYQDNN